MIEANDEGSSYAIPENSLIILISSTYFMINKRSEIDKILKIQTRALRDHNEIESLYNYILDRYNKLKTIKLYTFK